MGTYPPLYQLQDSVGRGRVCSGDVKSTIGRAADRCQSTWPTETGVHTGSCRQLATNKRGSVLWPHYTGPPYRGQPSSPPTRADTKVRVNIIKGLRWEATVEAENLARTLKFSAWTHKYYSFAFGPRGHIWGQEWTRLGSPQKIRFFRCHLPGSQVVPSQLSPFGKVVWMPNLMLWR